MITKLKNFFHLDFMTLKQYFTAMPLLLFCALVLFPTLMTGSILSTISIGLMIGILTIGYPFMFGEKNNLDALYTTLSIKRETVVQGRYIFTLLLNSGIILFSFALGSVGLHVVKTVGFSSGIIGAGFVEATLEAVILVFALFILIQAIQLPIYFKVGYTKAKFLNMMSFAVMIVCYFAFLNLPNISTWLTDFFMLSSSSWAVPILAGALTVIVLASYSLSVVLYKKREF